MRPRSISERMRRAPSRCDTYIGKPGVISAYHMNKAHWIGVLLDGSATDETVRELIELS